MRTPCSQLAATGLVDVQDVRANNSRVGARSVCKFVAKNCFVYSVSSAYGR